MGLPSPETMLIYASILEKPQYIVKNRIRYLLATGEVIEAACAALRECAAHASGEGYYSGLDMDLGERREPFDDGWSPSVGAK